MPKIVARRIRTRPLTVFSVTTDRRPREGEEESTGPDTQTALRREMAPDEFMATAALLGRSYAVPENDRRSSTAPTRPSSSSSAAGYTPTGRLGIVSAEAPPGRTPKSRPRPKPRPQVSADRDGNRVVTGTATRRDYLSPTPKVRSRVRPREDGTIENPGRTRQRTWPAGAKPPAIVATSSPATSTRPEDGGRAAEESTTEATAAMVTVVEADGPHPTAKPAPPVTVDEGLERELMAPDRPWLHNSLTGEPVKPAPIHRDRITGRLIVTWEEDQTVAYEGRAVLPQLGMKLFLSDLISTNDSAVICRSAPETPPTARQQMITKARTQDEAARLMEGASASDMHGSDTPPGAFAADDAVTRFVTKWLYMTAGLGDLVWDHNLLVKRPSPATPPLGCDHHSSKPWVLRSSSIVATSSDKDLLSPCHMQPHVTLIMQTIPHHRVIPTGPDNPSDLKSSQPAPKLHIPMPPHCIRLLHHVACGTRSFGTTTGLWQPGLARPSLGLLRSVTAPLHQCPVGSDAQPCLPNTFSQGHIHWHIPTLLRNRAYQHHPWTGQARGRRGKRATLRCPCRPARGAWHCRHSTDLLPCIATLTALDVLTIVPALWHNLNGGWAHIGTLHQASRPVPYCFQWTRHVLSLLSQSQIGMLLGHIMPKLIAEEGCRDHTATTAEAQTHTSRPRGTHTQGFPGPKSGERSRVTSTLTVWSRRMVMWLLQIQLSTGTLDARVVTSAQGVTGAGTDPPTKAIRTPAKPSLGTQATHASHPRSSTRVHKRTYARALRRAQLKGGAWYRGTWIGPDPRLSPPSRDTNKP